MHEIFQQIVNSEINSDLESVPHNNHRGFNELISNIREKLTSMGFNIMSPAPPSDPTEVSAPPSTEQTRTSAAAAAPTSNTDFSTEDNDEEDDDDDDDHAIPANSALNTFLNILGPQANQANQTNQANQANQPYPAGRRYVTRMYDIPSNSMFDVVDLIFSTTMASALASSTGNTTTRFYQNDPRQEAIKLMTLSSEDVESTILKWCSSVASRSAEVTTTIRSWFSLFMDHVPVYNENRRLIVETVCKHLQVCPAEFRRGNETISSLVRQAMYLVELADPVLSETCAICLTDFKEINDTMKAPTSESQYMLICGNIYGSNCNHHFCFSCFLQHQHNADGDTCPMCRSYIGGRSAVAAGTALAALPLNPLTL